MQKKCRVSGKTFEITEEDLIFYKKMGVSEPTLCPEERQRRRLSFRNDRTFYKRKCDLSGKSIISMYNHNVPFPVYHQNEWNSDNWNPMDYKQDFDFTRSFFEQFNDLILKVPRIGMDLVNCENSDYCNYCGDNKNCYIDIAGEGNEDCYFNLFTKFSKNIVDSTFIYNGEVNYESISCYECFNIKFCINLEKCSNCSFSIDLIGCDNCFLCSNLRNKKYCIQNKQYTKDEYTKKLNELEFTSNDFLKILKQQWLKLKSSIVYKNLQILNSVNSIGDNINNSKNVLYGFNVSNCENSNYLYDVLDAKNCRDLNYSLYEPEMSFELISTLNLKFSAFSIASHYCRDIFYCDQCNNSSNLFGCIGLRNKEYCIFNKQYSKEEYFELKEKIINHMEKTGEWGEFFPSSISPFGYNETVAQEYYPLTKEEALEKGFKWKDEEEKAIYEGPKYEIPDSINYVSDDILQKILTCECCSKNYRIVGPELQFYRKYNLPVPRKCPNCRHLNRTKLRNPRTLFDRKCYKCEKEIKSTYSQHREEIVYCEECYNREVY